MALPRFDKPLLVETDACRHGIGAVFMQEGHPLSYISRHPKGKQQHLCIYEKELLACGVSSAEMEQRLNIPIQQQWLPKLFEFDYEI